MKKLKITKQYADEFDKKCAKANSHGFLRFLTEPNIDNVSLLDLISQIENSIQWKPVKDDREIDLDKEKITKCMNEFFSKYLPKKAEEIGKILNGTHPYFIDREGGVHVNFIPSKKGDGHSGNVGHSDRRTYLEFNVYIHNSLDDLRTIAHELGHAISSHHKHLIELIRKDAPSKEIDKYSQKSFERDCIGEIESHITERLFNRFLLEKDICSKEDLKNYEFGQQASLISEINLIREEKDIISELSCPVSYESLNRLVKNLEKRHQDRLLERVEKMHDGNNRYSAYMFRYIVGRVVSEQWMKKFERLKDEKAKEQMLNNFQNYLDKTYKLDLNSACEELLNENFACVVEDYVLDKVNEKKEQREKTL